MTTTIDDAAAELHRRIDAPPGMVNTLGVSNRQKKVIRVLVDVSYWYRVGRIPKTFKGYPVKVEKRGAIEIGTQPFNVASRLSA